MPITKFSNNMNSPEDQKRFIRVSKQCKTNGVKDNEFSDQKRYGNSYLTKVKFQWALPNFSKVTVEKSSD